VNARHAHRQNASSTATSDSTETRPLAYVGRVCLTVMVTDALERLIVISAKIHYA
jgi:hypothetical protein